VTHVFHRHLRQHCPVAVAGAGPCLIDADGKGCLGGSGGVAVSCLDHGHPAVVAHESAEQYGLRMADELEAQIQRHRRSRALRDGGRA